MNRLTALGVLVVVAGVALTASGVYFALVQEAGLSDVRETEGSVVSAAVEPLGDGYYPNVTYRYEVDGEEYVSSNVFPPADQRRGSDRDDAEELVAGYRVGESVSVYYPAGEPANASLRAPRDPGPVFGVGFGLVAVFFGIVIFAAGRQRDQDRDVVLDDSPVPGMGSPDTRVEESGADDDGDSTGADGDHSDEH